LKILVTGGGGFIGTNFINYLVKGGSNVKDIKVVDKFTYAGHVEKSSRELNGIEIIEGDICNSKLMSKLIEWADLIINFAAESHVDRSIQDGSIFVQTNTLGAQNIFQIAAKFVDKRVIHISTDEVYGSVNSGSSLETDSLRPNSPYSASKAGADLLARSYIKTFEAKINITRSCNNFGPYQFPEKFIPLAITSLLRKKKIPIYGSGNNIREWIFVNEKCRAIQTIISSGVNGEIYNIGTGYSISNLSLAFKILEIMGLGKEMIEFVPDRLGHDFRYSLNSEKIEGIGFKNQIAFDEALAATINWYRDNVNWWTKRIANK
jgi:dTDP-glucose 4,6-dehydratase